MSFVRSFGRLLRKSLQRLVLLPRSTLLLAVFPNPPLVRRWCVESYRNSNHSQNKKFLHQVAEDESKRGEINLFAAIEALNAEARNVVLWVM